MPDAHLKPNTMPAALRPPRRRAILRRIQQSIKRSLSSNYTKMSYSQTSNLKEPNPDRSPLPSAITTSSSWFGSSKKNKGSHRKRASLGSLAQPGKVLSKEERERRKDSGTGLETPKSLEEQKKEDFSFRNFFQKVASWDLLHNLNASLGVNLAPEAAADVSWASEANERTPSARHFIVLLIAFLIVFGSLYSVVTHLLGVTRASAQCSPTTVVSTVTVSVPVTYTHTESIFVSPTACISTSAGPASSVIYTSTSTSTLYSTKTLTVISAMPSGSPEVTSSTLPFVFSVVSGTTSWVNGVSPSSGASLTTATTTVFVTPSEASSPLKTISTTSQTTQTHTTTVTPAVVSTSTSIVGPDLTSTVHVTQTDTVSAFATLTRTSFGGIGSSGWNLTDLQEPTATATITTPVVKSTPTTATISFFWASSGGHTYSTSTRIITTTLVRTEYPESNTTTHTIGRPWPRPTSSATSKNSTSSVFAAPSSTITNGGDSSAFPTMSPGTGGISPASGTATAPSGPLPTSIGTSPLSQSSEAQGVTGNPADATSTAPSNSSAVGAATTGVDSSSLSVGITSSSVETSSTPTETSSIGDSTLSPQETSTSAMGNSTSVAGYGELTPHPASGTTSAALGASPSSISTSPAASSVGVADITSTAAGASSTSLSSVTPSTQALSSIGSSLANGPPTATSTDVSSVTPLSQAPSSSSTTLANGQVPTSPSTSLSSSDTVTVTISSDSSSATLTNSQESTSSLSSSGSSSGSVTATTSSESASTTSTTTKTSASASASPTACGEHGDFMLDFDDLPSFSGDGDITQAPPIFSPYHHLTFSNGYVHAPKYKQPFVPHSGDQLAVFLASGAGNGTNDTAWHQPGMSASVPRTEPGDITDGPYNGLPAFWFNAYDAWLGCDNDGPDSCIFNVTGSTWDPTVNDDVETYNTQLEVPPCPNFNHCPLIHMDFPDNFRGLSGMQIQAFVNNKPVMFFMDDLALGWYDNSCEAGMKRMARPGTVSGPGQSGSRRKRVVRRTLMR